VEAENGDILLDGKNIADIGYVAHSQQAPRLTAPTHSLD
jgi:hypothetical protein